MVVVVAAAMLWHTLYINIRENEIERGRERNHGTNTHRYIILKANGLLDGEYVISIFFLYIFFWFTSPSVVVVLPLHFSFTIEYIYFNTNKRIKKFFSFTWFFVNINAKKQTNGGIFVIKLIQTDNLFQSPEI